MDEGASRVLGAVDRERSENANGLMSSLVIFTAAQEEQEWSCLKVGVISTAAVRNLVSLAEQRRKEGIK